MIFIILDSETSWLLRIGLRAVACQIYDNQDNIAPSSNFPTEVFSYSLFLSHETPFSRDQLFLRISRE